jgi:hypothetical protein
MAVVRPRERRDGVVVDDGLRDGPLVLHVPEANGSIGRAAREDPTFLGERERAHGSRVPLEPRFFAGARVPNRHRPELAARDELGVAR